MKKVILFMMSVVFVSASFAEEKPHKIDDGGLIYSDKKMFQVDATSDDDIIELIFTREENNRCGYKLQNLVIDSPKTYLIMTRSVDTKPATNRKFGEISLKVMQERGFCAQAIGDVSGSLLLDRALTMDGVYTVKINKVIQGQLEVNGDEVEFVTIMAKR